VRRIDLGASAAAAADRDAPGDIVILNGVPRSGKTSVVRALQARAGRVWVNLGVDLLTDALPERFRPGIGLRPGGERPDLEDLVVLLYAALFEAVAAHARLGADVVMDVGLHDGYSTPRHVAHDAARRLRGLPVLFVGLRCPLEVVRQRRRATWGQDSGRAGDGLAAAVERWQAAVHDSFVYDLELDTSVRSPDEAATAILERLSDRPGIAFGVLAKA
jgi:chloramphenicol 3-O phosphotransferase